MSSLRNAAPRRPHRERAQPLERQKWGLLEKHKDYSLRAKDFAAKKARLKLLRQKAVDANPDEFHFAMMSSRVDKHGVKIADRGNKSLPHDVVKLLKTQDKGYLKTMATKTAKDREKLENALIMRDGELEEGRKSGVQVLKDQDGTQQRRGNTKKAKRDGHIIFVDDDDTQKDFDPQKYFGTSREGLSKGYNRPRTSTSERDVDGMDVETALKNQGHRTKKDAAVDRIKRLKAEQKRIKQREQLVKQLEAVKTREKALRLAEQELDEQRAKMSNSIGGVNKNGVKFKIRERKR